MAKKEYEINPKERKRVIFFLISSILLLLLTFLIWEINPNSNFYDSTAVMGLTFLALVPAFLTNAFMPIVSNIPKIKRYPIDGGRYHKDGQRILGEGKSWNGFILGTLAAFGVSILIVHSVYPWIAGLTIESFSDGENILNFVTEEEILQFLDIQNNKTNLYLALFLICLSTPIGDMIGSYYKRRKKVERGHVFLFWDQNDFIILGGLIAWIFYPFTWYYYIFLLLITPILTIVFSLLGYIVGLKTHPW